MRLPVGYNVIVQLLTALHNIPADRQVALRGRLQHLRKLKFPPGVNTGRGTHAQYGAGQIVLLMVAFELAQLGVPPDRAVRMLRRSGSMAAHAAAQAVVRLGVRDDTLGSYLLCDPKALAGINDPEDNLLVLFSTDWKWLAEHLSPTALNGRTRHAIIDMRRLMLAASGHLSATMAAVPENEFFEATVVWANDYIERINAQLEKCDDSNP